MIKKHIHWLLPGQYNDLKSLEQNLFASIRLRSFVSSLNNNFYTFSFGENMPLNTSILVIGKIGSFDIEKRGVSWLNQIKMAHFSECKIILDYTDNHIMLNNPMTLFYKSILPFITYAVTPSEQMSLILSNFWKGSIYTIQDSIDIGIVKWNDYESKSLLWFGHSTNIQFLLNFLQRYHSKISDYTLKIITNQDGINYFTKNNNTDIHVTTKLWSLDTFINESSTCDICIIPSDKENLKKQGAGHNRLITSLALGFPTIATMLPSYEPFKDYFFDLDSLELSSALTNRKMFKRKVILAQKKIVPLFLPKVISRKWLKVFNI